MTEKRRKMHAGLPEAPPELTIAVPKPGIDRKRVVLIAAGFAAFLLIYGAPPLQDAVDPAGRSIPLSREGKASIGLLLLAAVWWIFEVVPIGVTSIAIGVFQVLFGIRPAREAFRDFMDPSVMFIFGSVIIGLAFSKTGLTKRCAYKMLEVAGERTGMILFGALALSAGLSHIMAHTAVAATVFPVLMAIYALYGGGEKQTNFGKALFIGMAYAASAGSIVTFFGSARAAAGAALFREFTGREIHFFELTAYLFLIGWGVVFLIWGYLVFFLKPEKKSIPGLKERVRRLAQQLGPMTRAERFVLGIVAGTVVLMSLQPCVPALKSVDRAAVILSAALLFFLFRVLTVKELEDIPWNIILLIGGAVSIGFCLWKTGAAQWMAVKWLALFQNAPWLGFVFGTALFVLVAANILTNVVVVTISLPVSLAIAPYMGVSPDIVFYTSLVSAGMPFMLLIGTAPNAIAYESGQFTAREFFKHGLLMSLALLVVIGVAVVILWPLLGMPVGTR
ncbi:MAG: SLC13 family permease [Nitrospirota bacterium]